MLVDLDHLYDALVTAEEVDGKIQLKGGHHYPVEAHDTLIVRKADRHIFRLFDELILKGKSIKDETFNRMVVAGPEGVGKVCYFCLVEFVRQKQEMYFCFLRRVGAPCISW